MKSCFPNLLFSIAFFVLIANGIYAQNIKVQPYLQDASPHSIFILWETDGSDESIVEWGLTNALGNLTSGIAQPSQGNNRIHTVQLENLERFTKYFYRVKSENAVSAIHSFKTPPFASDHQSFRIIAMSDMQRDGSFPNKFNEIVEEGIIDYLENEIGGDIIDNLALVLIPGDLVANGNNYTQWENTFFTPAQELFSQIPVYPVPGNHENNSTYFFQYFKLPENGTTGFEEHWWHKDYGNTRIIGIDSNNPFSNQEQLDWLSDVLDITCTSDSIDFVFAQLHHPHKSELWTPGESDYTGDVIELLENFTTNCNKPSIHFFGHTHGYSRGQSRDHKHLWINAATAGGAIDNWGEFPNFDYDEFSVSQDDYGFVSVEITDGDDPKIIVKRISRGDQDVIINNEVTDSLTLRVNSNIVTTPEPISPIDETVIPECVVLKANNFSDPNVNSTHGQSHWQVAHVQNDFSNPVAESWKNFENWYFEIDTQANDDLTDEEIIGLEENKTYWWRVRYRDRELNWSEWSNPVSFMTGESIALPNLLLNPGAEENLTNWTIIEGIVETLEDGICDGVAPHAGNKYFIVGGLCEHSAVGRCSQNIDVTTYTDSIETGNFLVNFGGYLSNYSGSDLPEMRLIFIDQNGIEIETSTTLSTLNPTWTLVSESMIIPSQTKMIQVELKGTRNGGTDNDSYFDDLFLSVGTMNSNCNVINSVKSQPFTIPTLEIVPNPVSSNGMIELPVGKHDNLQFSLVTVNGLKTNCLATFKDNRIEFEKGNLTPGTYLLIVKNNNNLVGTCKIIVL